MTRGDLHPGGGGLHLEGDLHPGAVNEWAVCILLECILVQSSYS